MAEASGPGVPEQIEVEAGQRSRRPPCGAFIETPDGGVRPGEDQSADRTVAKTVVEDILVSTVFLAMDHSFGGDGPPVLYETMLFNQAGNEDDTRQRSMWRYCTRAQALEGHRAAVRQLEAEFGVTGLWEVCSIDADEEPQR